jgi:Zn-dependent protease with chaperone function
LNEDKSVRYHRLKRRAAVASVAITAMLFAALLATGFSSSIAEAARRLSHAAASQYSPRTIAIYVVILALLQETLTFPLSWYQGFLLERRYGLSLERFGGWLRDHLKAVGLGLVLSVAGAEAVYVSMQLTPAWWWLLSAASFVLATAGIARIAPVVLLPMFYRFTPLERESLRNRLVSLSARAGVPVLGVYEWALGEKSRRANAALVGTGSTRRIIISDTLLAEYSDDEIEVILAHEIGHHIHHDILMGFIAESVLLVMAFFVAALTLHAWGPRLGLTGDTDVAGLPLLLLVGGGVSMLATPVVNALSRWNERRADRYALTLTGHAGAFISAMRRLGNQNLAEEQPSRIALWLFHSHPPIEQRIEAARTFL